MADPFGNRFWLALLDRRVTKRWGNFSWLSIYTVLASGNDALAKLDGGRIIDTRRMRWVAAQRAAGVDVCQPIRLGKARSILVVGDPGEMDPSQYVLLRDLAAAKVDALLLMSDIVYPAGDINAWRDAVYLPYFGLPKACWEAAEQASHPVPLPEWPVFATPGNHDWYDGLNGFMYHACAAEPLPSVTYSTSGLGLVQRLTRRAWQNPARPDRPMLDPLRAEAARRWTGKGRNGPMPTQPGPYFTIDIGKVHAGTGAERAALRIVTVDTGVDGSIDVEQARWVRRMLEGPTPKVVVTGKPLIIGNVIRDIPINHSSVETGGDGLPAGLRGLLAEPSAECVIANVAGDTHNAQRVVLVGTTIAEPGQPTGRACASVELGAEQYDCAKAARLPPVQIVAGGGGAYLSETHRTRLEGDGSLQLELKDGTPALDDVVPMAAHHRFPSREVSARHFTITVGRNVSGLLLGVGVLFAATVLTALWRGGAAVGRDVVLDDRSVPVWHILGASYVLLVFVGTGVAAVAQLRRRRYVAATVVGAVALVALAAVYVLWDVPWPKAKHLALGTAIALAVPALPLSGPVVQAFPLLARFVPTKTLVVTALGTAGALLTKASTLGYFLGALIVAILGVAGGLVVGRRMVARAVELNDHWVLHRTHKIPRFLFAVATLWPLLFVVVPVLALRPSHGSNDIFDLAVLMLCLELGLALLLLAAFLATSVVRAWRFCPIPVLAGIVVLSVIAGTAAGVFAGELTAFAGILKQLGVGIVAAQGAAFVAVAVVLLPSPSPAPHDHVAEALARRDGVSDTRRRSINLFRTMLIAGTPGVSEIAEASRPPFHKSFLVVDVEYADAGTQAVVFRTYGVDDERAGPSTVLPGRATPPEKDQLDARGAFLVDTLTVKLSQT